MVMLKLNSLSPCDYGSYKLPNADATKIRQNQGKATLQNSCVPLAASEHSSSTEIRQNL